MVAGLDNATTAFPMIAAVQPGNSGGAAPCSVCKGACMNDVAALVTTNSVPQTVNFGIKSDVTTSFLRVNGVEPKCERGSRGGLEGVYGTDDVCAYRL